MAVDQDEIHILSLSENVEDRLEAARLLQDEFESLPDKSAAWDDIHRLITDDNSLVRAITTYTIGCFFRYVPEESKSIAWNHLVKRVEEVNSDEDLMPVREAAYALCRSFEYVPADNKPQAWLYLIKFPVDGHFVDVKDDVASSFKYLFGHIPNEYKSQAWDDLVRLMSVYNDDVKYCTISALSHIYSSVPDKSAVWHDFQLLVNDEDSYIRMCANHSLGKICIDKASKSENETASRAFLEEAIRYFEIAANEQSWENPAKFCNLFYRSFDAVFFKRVSSKNEIDEYIAAAKKEIQGSESKQKLLEAVEQLAEVLETAQNAREDGIEHQELLKRCSAICNHVDQLMDENKDKTPAIHELYRKAKPSFDKEIKDLIEDVKKKAEEACREAKGEYKVLACSINKNVSSLDTEAYKDPINANLKLDSALNLARGKISLLPDFADMDETIENALLSSSTEQKADAVYEILRRIPQDTSDNASKRWIASIGIGGVFMSAVVLLSPNDPNINYVSVAIGLIFTGLTFYLLS